MFIVYTDDCICFSKTKTVPDKLIKDLKDDGFLLKDEGDARDFLGVTITRNTEKQTIMMTQTGLIDSILFDLGLTTNNEYMSFGRYRVRSKRKREKEEETLLMEDNFVIMTNYSNF